MLARLQQGITLGLLAFALGVAAFFLHRGQPGWATAGFLLVVFGYAVVLGLEFVLLWFVQEASPTPRPTAGMVLRAWWGEITHSPRVFCWRQPFRSNVEPDRLEGTPGQRGVVFVHGFVCNRGFWNPWLARCRMRGIPFIAVNLEPVFGSIDTYATIIDEAVDRLQAATGQAPLLVAHSMGGLAVRAWLHREGGSGAVHDVVTIGTPHRGTWMARWGRTINGIEMRMDSPLVTRLGVAGTPEHHARFTCFHGNCDNIVFPASTATLPGARNVHLSGVAHVQMAFQPAVYAEVFRQLGQETA